MPNKRAFLEFVLERLAPLGKVTARAMFGGHCLYCDGHVFALIANNELFLKADDWTRPRFLSKGLKPFHPFDKDDSVMSYFQAPAELLEDEDALRDWGGIAVDAGRRAKTRSRRAKNDPPKHTSADSRII